MAWWLLDSVINGTLDEDYPIMSKDDDVVILGGDGNDTISFKSLTLVSFTLVLNSRRSSCDLFFIKLIKSLAASPAGDIGLSMLEITPNIPSSN